MLKTNSKKAMENIKKTVIEEVMYLLEERIEQGEVFDMEKPATSYLGIIEEEKRYKNYPNDYEMVKDWLEGLGGGFFSAAVYLKSAKKLVGEWLEETDNEIEKYSEVDAENKAVYLFTRELLKMVKKENK